MKKFILLLVSLLPLLLFSQYGILSKSNAHWIVGYWDVNNPPWEPTDIYQYVVKGDSIFQDTEYKKVYYRDMINTYPHLIENEFLVGLVRDDSLNKKVYAVDFGFPWLPYPNLEEEFLLYDFNADVGDTLFTYFMYSTVESIMYEYLYNETRKVFYVWDGFFIEGIGSNYGVFEWGYGSDGWAFELYNYCLGTDEECGCQWVGIENKENPLNFIVSILFRMNYVDILVKDNSNIEVLCSSTLGDIMFKSISKKNIRIDISAFSPGMYIIFINDKKNTLTKKIIIY